MIVDHRIYRLKPGTTQAYLENYEKIGFAPQTKHLGQPVAYMFGESGDINTVVHLWAYEDVTDRATRRAALWADPDWHTYVKKLNESGYLVEQKTSLMIPAKFAPIKR